MGMETFLDETLEEYNAIGLTQDNLIKLIFILRDNPTREMIEIEAEDAKFAVDNKERIKKYFKSFKGIIETFGII